MMHLTCSNFALRPPGIHLQKFIKIHHTFSPNTFFFRRYIDPLRWFQDPPIDAQWIVAGSVIQTDPEVHVHHLITLVVPGRDLHHLHNMYMSPCSFCSRFIKSVLQVWETCVFFCVKPPRVQRFLSCHLCLFSAWPILFIPH